MELLTNRFLLRDFVEEDSPAFVEFHADPRSVELAIIRRKAPQQLLGCCGLRGAGSATGEAELGIELAPQYWGRHGYAVEAMRALADFGFGTLGLNVIYGSTVSVNARIARLAGSFGAVAVARPSPAWMLARGWSQVEWQFTREQWERGRLATTMARGARTRNP